MLCCVLIVRIIEPIASRCAKFRFKPLSEDVMRDRLVTICRSEHVTYEEHALKTLCRLVNGDMRRAITYLESAANIGVTESNIKEICGIVPNEVVEKFLSGCRVSS
jgi:replication factor C subunit 2/4